MSNQVKRPRRWGLFKIIAIGSFAVAAFLTIGGPFFCLTWTTTKSVGSRGSGDGQFIWPMGLAFDGNNEIYVVDNQNCRLQVFDIDGVFLRKWGTLGSGDSQFNYPLYVAINSSNYVYITDTGNDRVSVFTSTGTFVNKWTVGDPWGIAINGSGYVYVAEYNNNNVSIYTMTGALVGRFGGVGSGDGQLWHPTGIAINSTGYVYVVDNWNNRIQIFNQTGAFIGKFGSPDPCTNFCFNRPEGIAIASNGEVYVTDAWNSRVIHTTSTGQILSLFGSPGNCSMQYNGPAGIAVATTGEIYVVDKYNCRIIFWAENEYLNASFFIFLFTVLGVGVVCLIISWRIQVIKVKRETPEERTKRQAEAEAKRRAKKEAEAKRQAETEAKRRGKEEEQVKRQVEADTKRRAEEEGRTRKLQQVIKVSNRLSIQRIAEVLEMSAKDVWKKVFDWAEKFNFKIEGEELVFNQATVNEFIESLDKEFSQWGKDGKVEKKE